MGHLMRKFARESKHGKRLMEQYQPDGAYERFEAKYKEDLAHKKEVRVRGRLVAAMGK
jgi:hypothetical protein